MLVALASIHLGTVACYSPDICSEVNAGIAVDVSPTGSCVVIAGACCVSIEFKLIVGRPAGASTTGAMNIFVTGSYVSPIPASLPRKVAL